MIKTRLLCGGTFEAIAPATWEAGSWIVGWTCFTKKFYKSWPRSGRLHQLGLSTNRADWNLILWNFWAGLISVVVVVVRHVAVVLHVVVVRHVVVVLLHHRLLECFLQNKFIGWQMIRISWNETARRLEKSKLVLRDFSEEIFSRMKSRRIPGDIDSLVILGDRFG